MIFYTFFIYLSKKSRLFGALRAFSGLLLEISPHLMYNVGKYSEFTATVLKYTEEKMLEKIKSPKDIKNLSHKEITELCGEIPSTKGVLV